MLLVLFACKFFNPPRTNMILHITRFFSVLLVLFLCKFFNPPKLLSYLFDPYFL
nr:MAG TPA: hypothetical protein [Caudoviricetes sp.]